MSPTVVAAFADRASATAAADALDAAGFKPPGVRWHDSTSTVRNAASIELDEVVTGGFVGNFADLLNGLFNAQPAEDDAATYADMVRREGAIVSVRAGSPEAAERVSRMLQEAGATRMSTFPQPGLES